MCSFRNILQKPTMDYFHWILLIGLLLLFSFRGQCQEETLSTLHGCNSTIREGEGILISPNYPRPYNSSIYCQWNITVEEGRTILLYFRIFALESSPSCKYDHISVYNGPSRSHPLLGRFCGSFRPADVVTTSNRMLLTFESDDSTEKEGFFAAFVSVDPQLAGPDTCGGLLTSASGSFHSINFPKSNYPNSLTCVWHIRAPIGNEVVLTFAKLTLEVSNNCKYDYVSVFSGWSTRSETAFLGRFCKISDVPEEIVSRGNEMFITFASDASGNDVGFSASYSTRLAPTRGPNIIETEQTDNISVATMQPSTETLEASTSSLALIAETTVSEDVSSCPSSCVTSQSVSVLACSSQFVASVKILKLDRLHSGTLRIRAILLKTLKSGVPMKKKTKFWIEVSCPECHPTIIRRHKYIFAGSDVESLTVRIRPGDFVANFSKKLQKSWKKQIRRCGRRNRQRQSRNNRK